MAQLTGITLFSGIGGVSCGMRMAGIEVAASVEFDIENQAYSATCQEISNANFPDADFYLNPVGEVADLLPGCDILQASPVCASFSALSAFRNNGVIQETLADTQMATDTVKAIIRCDAPYFCLEQVVGYQKTRSLDIIVKALNQGNYTISTAILDAADYGVAQNRKRLFLLASKQGKWEFPLPAKRQVGWKEAIAGIELIPSATLTKEQRAALVRSLDSSYDLSKGVLIQRTGINICVRRHNEPCWTLTRSSFTDGKNAARKEIINVVNDRGIWSLPIRAIARLCSFPDSYQLPGRHVGQGLGYCVPPKLVKQLLLPISSKVSV